MAAAATITLFGVSVASAETPDGTWRIGAAGGVSYFATSQSKVPQHLLKPTARFEFFRRVRGLEVGAAIAGVASGDAGYRLVGAYALLEAPLYEGPVFDTALTFGVGLGTGARIQHHDLATDPAITVWAKAGLALRWWVPGGAALGLSLESEHLTTVNLSVTVAYRF